ncbi:MAG: peptide ligase PGM1-related protein [Thermaurantiacus sp.]
MLTSADALARLDRPLAPEDAARFAGLKARLAHSLPELMTRPEAPRTVVVIPSLSMDQEVLARIEGGHHYEERMLCLLLLLRLPRTRLVYVTSAPVPEAIIDYYLNLLPGVPAGHARQRLTMLSCDDVLPGPLSAKLLARPRMLDRLRRAVGDTADAHMSCFAVTPLERELALRLDLPIYGCDPALMHLGSKSGSRQIFRAAGIPLPPGREDLSDMDEVAEALAELKAEHPHLRKAVVKLNEGFSGEGNAIFRFADAPGGAALARWVKARMGDLRFEAAGMSPDTYAAKFREMGGIVEAFVEGGNKRSPSVQLRIDPEGRLAPISTHDQLLGGAEGQVFMGCRFPADAAYACEIQALAMRAGAVLAERGALGRFAIDFISVERERGWEHFAIEVNLRKGGTTHPFLMLQFLTDGRYDPATGRFLTPQGRAACYVASDNVEADAYRGLLPDDLIDIAVLNRLHYHGGRAEGVVFHLIGALSEHGKLGMVAIGETPERADALFHETVEVLDRETGAG